MLPKHKPPKSYRNEKLYVRNENNEFLPATDYQIRDCALSKIGADTKVAGKAMTAPDEMAAYVASLPDLPDGLCVFWLDNRHHCLGYEKVIQTPDEKFAIDLKPLVASGLRVNAAACIFVDTEGKEAHAWGESGKKINALKEWVELVDITILDFIAIWEPEKEGAKKPNWVSMTDQGMM